MECTQPTLWLKWWKLTSMTYSNHYLYSLTLFFNKVLSEDKERKETNIVLIWFQWPILCNSTHRFLLSISNRSTHSRSCVSDHILVTFHCCYIILCKSVTCSSSSLEHIKINVLYNLNQGWQTTARPLVCFFYGLEAKKSFCIFEALKKWKGGREEEREGQTEIKGKILSRNSMYHAKFKIFTTSPLQKSLPTPILNCMYTVWIEILYIYFCIYLTYTQPLTHMCVNSGCFRVVRLEILYILLYFLTEMYSIL